MQHSACAMKTPATPREIKPGDLVMWLVDMVVDEITETGIVMELSTDDSGEPGAKVSWKSGVYWSPLKLIRSIRDYEVY